MCYLSHTANTMSVDLLLVILGASASAGKVMTDKDGMFFFQHQKN